MTQINWSRVALGGVVWCLTYNLLTGAAWFAFLHSWGDPSFHPLLGASQSPTAGRVASFLLLTLAMGIFAMWFYAAIRPRYVARRVTFAYVGIALWLVWGLLPNWPSPVISSAPVGPLLAELVSKLVVLIIATAVGAHLYRETAAQGLSPSAS